MQQFSAEHPRGKSLQTTSSKPGRRDKQTDKTSKQDAYHMQGNIKKTTVHVGLDNATSIVVSLEAAGCVCASP